jgi:hypothetical protein
MIISPADLALLDILILSRKVCYLRDVVRGDRLLCTLPNLQSKRGVGSNAKEHSKHGDTGGEGHSVPHWLRCGIGSGA